MVAAPGNTIENLDTLRRDVNALNFNNLAAKVGSGTPLTTPELRQALTIVGRDFPAVSTRGEGLLLDGAAGPALRVWRFGGGLFSFVRGGVATHSDLENLGLGPGVLGGAVGAGSDRSAQIGAAGQTLADSLAATGNLSQNQAEELVFQAEQGGVNAADPASRNALTSFVNANPPGAAPSVLQNQTGARVRGLFTEELTVGYGQPIGDMISLGVTLKGIWGVTYSKDYVFRNLPKTPDLVKDLIAFERTENSFALGVDAGALITPTNWLAFGVTGKNLDFPAFRLDDGRHLVVDPNARAGVAVFPVPWVTLAADVDLFQNSSTVLPGYHSQVVCGGAEFDLGLVALRAGVSKNIADPTEQVLLHAGAALRILRFTLEAAVACTPALRDIESMSAKLPQRVGGAITCGVNIDF
jgi:hypothetical protein